MTVDLYPDQPWLFDPGPTTVSMRMLDRRAILREACRRGDVALLRLVAARAGVSFSTLWRWRRIDPGIAEILQVVWERKRARRRRR